MSSDGLNISFNASAGVSRPLKSTTLLTLRNAFNILESLTKNRIIVFRRVWAHIIFTNNISNQGFLSKNNHIFSGTKNVVLFKKISFHTDG